MGAAFPQPIVEESEIQAIDRRVHKQLVDVGELSDDANVAAGDCGRERRQVRVNRADVRDRVKCRRRLNDRSASIPGVRAIRPEPDTARRGDAASSFSVIDVDVDADLSDDLADPLVADEEIADRAADVVARPIERPAAARIEIEPPRDDGGVSLESPSQSPQSVSLGPPG